MRPKAPFHFMTREELLELAKLPTMRAIMITLGYHENGHTRTMIRQRLLKEGIQVPDGRVGKAPPHKLNLESALKENCTHARYHLKQRLLKEGLLVNRCYICGNEPVWQGKELVLRLDHINGVKDDYRLENLRMVCPNCDSQLPTFSGRNKRIRGSSNRQDGGL